MAKSPTELATELLRVTARAFYPPEYAIVIDALIFHWTLKDQDLATVLGMQPKALRKLCGRLREDGLLQVQTRAERRTDQAYVAPNGKERLSSRDWYYLNFHRAIDSIKYRLNKLIKHNESLGLPTTEKKDLSCPRCKSQYTELEVMDSLDMQIGAFLCHRCKHPLDPMEEDERANENQSVKRLNQQLEKILSLLQQIDQTTVPENDFDHANSKAVPLVRSDNNPGARIETVDLPGRNVQSTKGMEIKPEKITVQIQDEAEVKKENAAADAEARKAKEAQQNSLPVWITESTVNQGEITSAGFKEAEQRRAREAHSGGVKTEESEEKKPAVGDDDIMAAYWEQLEREKEAEKAKEAAEEEDEEDDEDEFEDVDVGGSTPANGANGKAPTSTGMNTPMGESSNATDDERETKRVRIADPSSSAAVSGANGQVEKPAADTPAASDEDEDDELEFENV